MEGLISLKNNFLIAMPSLGDSSFYHTVTYIYKHNEEGAMGIVINKPMRITLGDVLHHLSIPIKQHDVEKYPILLGGPVAPEQGFIIHRSEHLSDEPTLATNDDITVSTSRNVLQAIAAGTGPKDVMVSLGYSGWKPGQLEAELTTNVWLVAPAKAEILFKTPFEYRWQFAAASIGVDLNLLVPDVGHA